MRYRCLVLDHDDTVVMSTPEVNYPSFLNTLQAIRPGVHYSLAEFMEYCYAPGFHAFCQEILGFTPEEMQYEFETWKAYSAEHGPSFFPGMAELVRRQKAEGGLVAVVSHSSADNIRRDYRKFCGMEPDAVFGWELGEEKRKPAPYPIEEILRRFSLSQGELLMVDDLKPGFDMAAACGVDFAWAGWSCASERIRCGMEAMTPYCFTAPAELYRFQFASAPEET